MKREKLWFSSFVTFVAWLSDYFNNKWRENHPLCSYPDVTRQSIPIWLCTGNNAKNSHQIQYLVQTWRINYLQTHRFLQLPLVFLHYLINEVDCRDFLSVLFWFIWFQLRCTAEKGKNFQGGISFLFLCATICNEKLWVHLVVFF